MKKTSAGLPTVAKQQFVCHDAEQKERKLSNLCITSQTTCLFEIAKV